MTWSASMVATSISIRNKNSLTTQIAAVLLVLAMLAALLTFWTINIIIIICWGIRMTLLLTCTSIPAFVALQNKRIVILLERSKNGSRQKIAYSSIKILQIKNWDRSYLKEDSWRRYVIWYHIRFMNGLIQSSLHSASSTQIICSVSLSTNLPRVLSIWG